MSWSVTLLKQIYVKIKLLRRQRLLTAFLDGLDLK